MEKVTVRGVEKKTSAGGDAFLSVKTDSGFFSVWKAELFEAFKENTLVEIEYTEKGKYKNITMARAVDGEVPPAPPPTEKKKWTGGFKKSYGGQTQAERLELESLRADGQAKGNYRTIAANHLIAFPKATKKDIQTFNEKLKFSEVDYFGVTKAEEVAKESTKVTEDTPWSTK